MNKQLKKRLVSITAIIAVLVLVFACSKFNLIEKNIKTNIATVENSDRSAQNSIDVIKDSTGINLKIKGENDNGVNKIEVYQGTKKIRKFSKCLERKI